MKVTLHIASAINCLTQIEKLPQDMTTTFLTIMQTRSVDEFNKVFAAIEVPKALDGLNQSSCFNYTSYSSLSVAKAQCLELFEKGQWTGATTKWQESAFTAHQWTNAKFLKYHNCGKPGCRVDICPHCQDKDKSKSNRKLFMNSKKANGGGGGSGHKVWKQKQVEKT
jgi:hypothetical protein